MSRRLLGFHLGAAPRVTSAMVALITAGFGAGALAALLGFGRHDPAPKEREPYAVAEICPGVDAWAEAFHEAGRQLREAGVHAPPTVLAACDGPPAAEHAQIRPPWHIDGDYRAQVGREAHDLVVHREDPRGRTAIAYILERGSGVPDCTAAHVLGHLAGLGHTTGASSVMASPCGPRYTHLGGAP